VVPAYNEAQSVTRNLSALCHYMETLEGEYRWELIVVNDGSTDDTGRLADEFARTRDNVHILHHVVNFGLGQALRFGFGHCRGDYVVTMDFDLSYSPDHIGALLQRIRTGGAKVVVTSPYMKGGRISNVPWLRRTMSIWANRFLSLASNRSVSTLTGMVRAYDGAFLRSLSLRSMYMEIFLLLFMAASRLFFLRYRAKAEKWIRSPSKESPFPMERSPAYLSSSPTPTEHSA